jgi:hypothetical protein
MTEFLNPRMHFGVLRENTSGDPKASLSPGISYVFLVEHFTFRDHTSQKAGMKFSLPLGNSVYLYLCRTLQCGGSRAQQDC